MSPLPILACIYHSPALGRQITVISLLLRRMSLVDTITSGGHLKRTMFSTPILRHGIWAFCQLGLKMMGWKIEGKPPTVPKYVVIAVPHTSNWDFPLALSIAFVYGIDIHWMGKASLFKGWRGPVMKWLGGIPIYRSSSQNVVAQTIGKFKTCERLVVAVPPEGTRSRVEKWKTGFYYIALGAGVPIALGFLDYKRKVGGFLSAFSPSGDVDKDIAEIRASYSGISGKYTELSTVE